MGDGFAGLDGWKQTEPVDEREVEDTADEIETQVVRLKLELNAQKLETARLLERISEARRTLRRGRTKPEAAIVEALGDLGCVACGEPIESAAMHELAVCAEYCCHATLDCMDGAGVERDGAWP